VPELPAATFSCLNHLDYLASDGVRCPTLLPKDMKNPGTEKAVQRQKVLLDHLRPVSQCLARRVPEPPSLLETVAWEMRVA
jgi:hypothetical protein